MSEESINRNTVQTYVRAMNAGDEDLLRSVFAPDARIEGVTGGGSVDDAMPIWRQLHDGLEMLLEVTGMVASGDTVVVRYLESGRWSGTFLHFDRPTGRHYQLCAMEWFVLQDGRITHRWGVRDAAAQARQVGFPLPAGKEAA